MTDVAVRASAISGATTSTTVSVAAPTGTATGDVVIVMVVWNNVVTISDNNGATPFTKDWQKQESGSGSTIAVFSRRIQAGDPSSYSFTCGTSSRATAIAVAFSNPNASAIYDVAPADANSNPSPNVVDDQLTTISITTTIDGSIHVVGAEIDAAAGTFTGVPAGYASQQNGGTQPSVVATKTITPAGSTGAKTFTRGTGGAGMNTSFAVKNSGGGGGVVLVQRRVLLGAGI